jgi:hypothetical protein
MLWVSKPARRKEMDLGKELWAAYLERECPPDDGHPPSFERLRPEAIAELIWPFGFEIDARRSKLIDAEPSPAFDDEADEILAALARTGRFPASEQASPGAWAVLSDRFGWSIAALTLEEANPNASTIPVPLDAPIEVRRTAAALYVLGTLGRSPPPQWRDAARR